MDEPPTIRWEDVDPEWDKRPEPVEMASMHEAVSRRMGKWFKGRYYLELPEGFRGRITI